MDALHPDAKVIDRLGGPSILAQKLGFDPKSGGVQRVQNWKRRGIPELIRLRRPDVFGAPPAHQAAAAPNGDEAAGLHEAA